MNIECTRPVLRWHGGKWLLAPRIIEHFPPHRVYVEAFGGAASVLLRKARSYGEVYNDLDDEAVNLFRVLRSSDAPRLIELLTLTPFARSEFEVSYEPAPDPVEKARRLVIRSFMGFGSDGHNQDVVTGFRSNANRAGTVPAQDWRNFPEALAFTVDRLRGVVIECRDAKRVTSHHDSDETLHYLDPPYMPETRSTKSRKSGERYHAYRHEMSAEEHRELLDHAKGLAGMVVISGYSSPLYERELSKWMRVQRQSLADGARPRVENLWLNEKAWLRLPERQESLFT